jgi:hypothetical protein
MEDRKMRGIKGGEEKGESFCGQFLEQCGDSFITAVERHTSVPHKEAW